MRVAVASLLAVTAAAALACKSGQTASPSPGPAPSSAPTPAPQPGLPAGNVAANPGAPGGPGGPGGAPGARRPRPSPAAMDTMRRGMVARMLTEIAGRENEPAEKVYQNIQMWKGLPARALLDTMNAYGRALGMTCTGCHVGGQWASDDRQNKKLAREMQAMVNDLNTRQLASMKNIDADFPRATCGMCHRGAGHPAQTVSLDAQPGPMGPPPGQRPPND